MSVTDQDSVTALLKEHMAKRKKSAVSKSQESALRDMASKGRQAFKPAKSNLEYKPSDLDKNFSPEKAYKGKYRGPDKYKGVAPEGGKWKGKYIGKDSDKGQGPKYTFKKKAPRPDRPTEDWTDAQGLIHRVKPQ